MTWKRLLCLAGVLVAGSSWGQQVAQAASGPVKLNNLENARIINYWITANDIGSGRYQTRLYKTVLTHQPENSIVPQLPELTATVGNFSYDQHQKIQGEVTDVVYTSQRMVDEKVIFIDVDDHNQKVGPEIIYLSVSKGTGGWPNLPLPKGYQLVDPEDAHRLLINSSRAWRIRVKRIDKTLPVHPVPQLPDQSTTVTPPDTSTEKPGHGQVAGPKPQEPQGAKPGPEDQPGGPAPTGKPAPTEPNSTAPQSDHSESVGSHSETSTGTPSKRPAPNGSHDKAPQSKNPQTPQPEKPPVTKPSSDGQPARPVEKPAPDKVKPERPQPGPSTAGMTPQHPQNQTESHHSAESQTGHSRPDTSLGKPAKPVTPNPNQPQHPGTAQPTLPQANQHAHQSSTVSQPQGKPIGPAVTKPSIPQPHDAHRPRPTEPLTTTTSAQTVPVVLGRPMTQPHSALQEALAAVPDQPDPQTDSTTNPHPAHLDHVATLDDSINQSPTRHRQKVHRHLRSHTQSKTRAVKSLATAKDGQQLPQTTERADRWSWLGWLLLGTTLTSSWVYRRLR